MSQHLSTRRASSPPAAPTSRGFNARTRTCESVVMLLWVVVVLLSAPAVHAEPGSGVTGLNSTVSPPDPQPSHNSTDAAAGSRVSTILRDLPTIKSVSIFVCVLTTLLITCLLAKIYSSAKKIRKTRKYDIITTPAERVEMAPLNEDDDDDDDSTLFDVKYR